MGISTLRRYPPYSLKDYTSPNYTGPQVLPEGSVPLFQPPAPVEEVKVEVKKKPAKKVEVEAEKTGD